MYILKSEDKEDHCGYEECSSWLGYILDFIFWAVTWTHLISLML